MKKGQLSNLLRNFGLIYFTDRVRYHLQKFENRKVNKDFKIWNPAVKLPPDYLIYESFQLNYKKYYTQGIETAKWLTDHFKKHIELKDKKNPGLGLRAGSHHSSPAKCGGKWVRIFWYRL